jgi:hypothetical protein
MPMLFAAKCTAGEGGKPCGKESCAICSVGASDGSLLAGGDVDSETLMTGIVGAVLTVFRYIGIILLVWSIGQLVMAFKDGDGNSKTQAAMMIVVSVLLIGLKTFLSMANVI